MSKYNDSQNKASQKYIKANLEQISFRVPKGKKIIYQDKALKNGKSLTKLIVDFLDNL